VNRLRARHLEFVAGLLAVLLASGGASRAYSQKQDSLPHRAPSQTLHAGACASEQIELLSCNLKAHRKVSLCLDKHDQSYALHIYSLSGHSEAISLSGARQAYFPSQDEPTTVLEWTANGGYVRVYIFRILDSNDSNIPNNDSITAKVSHDHVVIRLSRNGTSGDLYCRQSGLTTPVAGWAPPGKESMGGTNIWQLQSLGLATSYDFDPDSEGGWPNIVRGK
jgi:hypothetical protein